MDQCERIRLILEENQLKQKQFAAAIGVTEGYISKLLKDPSIHLSQPLAALIEEKFGYRAGWVLRGDAPKRREPELSELHRRALARLEAMSGEQVKAVLAFINSLEDVERSFSQSGDGMPPQEDAP